MTSTLIELVNLKKHFDVHGGVLFRKQGVVYAVDGIDLVIKKGETLGIVGESGCGKSTLGKTLLRLYEPTEGEVLFESENILEYSKSKMRALRREMQIIFQDPYESLNPRHTVGHIIEEPLIIHKIGTPEWRKEEVKRLLKRVGLPESALERYPHEFSGGQRQRIGIARAVALKPKLILCDEPVSALDVSVQSQILNLLMELQEEMQLTYIFIAHDLAVVKHISDRIAVMYLGKIVEIGTGETINNSPKHPYTKALISAIPEPDPTVKKIKEVLIGDVPSPRNPPSGCRFHTRCPYAQSLCQSDIPVLTDAPHSENGEHLIACHFAENLVKRSI